MFRKHFMKDGAIGRSLDWYPQEMARALALAQSISGVLGGNWASSSLYLLPSVPVVPFCLWVWPWEHTKDCRILVKWWRKQHAGTKSLCNTCCCLLEKNILTCLTQIQPSSYRLFIWAFQRTKSGGSSSAISPCEHYQLNSQCFCLLSY